MRDGKRVTVQTLSGTGALRVAGAFLHRFLPPGTKLMLPDPTWANHIPIFEDSGFQLLKYRYYRPADCGLDLDGMLEDIDKAPRGSVVLLHACAHNPTGVDPTQADWKAISKVVAARDHKVKREEEEKDYFVMICCLARCSLMLLTKDLRVETLFVIASPCSCLLRMAMSQ